MKNLSCCWYPGIIHIWKPVTTIALCVQHCSVNTVVDFNGSCQWREALHHVKARGLSITIPLLLAPAIAMSTVKLYTVVS